LDTLLDLLPPSQANRPGSVNPRASVAALFDLVKRQDSLVAALVAGTRTTDTAVTAADAFRVGHEAITRLGGELRP
jgi:hypothetical protein